LDEGLREGETFLLKRIYDHANQDSTLEQPLGECLARELHTLVTVEDDRHYLYVMSAHHTWSGYRISISLSKYG